MRSIYRSSIGNATNTGYLEKKSEAQLRDAAARNEAGKSKRSNGEPTNVALPRTLEWAFKLPLDAQPHELIRPFGRVANLVAANWDDTEATVACLNDLLVDTREGCRTGFPPKVVDELLVLQTFYALRKS